MFQSELRVILFLAFCACLWNLDQSLCVSPSPVASQSGVGNTTDLYNWSCSDNSECQIHAGKEGLVVFIFQFIRLMFLGLKSFIGSWWWIVLLVIGGLVAIGGAFSEQRQ